MQLRECIFDLIAPYDCLVCSAEGSLVCAWCWPELFEMAPEECFVCHQESVEAKVCRPCQAQMPCDQAVVITPYRGGAKALVRAMKIDAQRQAAVLIARVMHEMAPTLSADYVTSVPTATTRVRERGFDHSRLIAEKFARSRGLLYRQLLVRQGKAKQAGANKTQRAQQVQNAYEVGRSGLEGRNILVIDDVSTTGATLSEVAKVLRAAGAQQVTALVFARAT